jgi:hypothetical protein
MRKVIILVSLLLFPTLASAENYKIAILLNDVITWNITVREQLEDNLYREHLNIQRNNSIELKLDLQKGSTLHIEGETLAEKDEFITVILYPADKTWVENIAKLICRGQYFVLRVKIEE